MIITLVLLAWSAISVAIAARQVRKAEHRIAIITVATNTLAVLALARALAPWPGVTGWGWAVTAAGLGAVLALAACRWPDLPGHSEETPHERRGRAQLGAASPLLLVAFVGWTFV